jgi:adenosine deaminase
MSSSVLAGYPRWADAEDPLLALSKVSLHDHLDGSLRPETMLELADAQGIRLPYQDPDKLARWFQGGIAVPVVENWDEKFGITTRLLQTPQDLARAAHEFVLDLAADGVVYGEARWAPEKHTLGDMSLDDAVDAVAVGLAAGEQAAREAGRAIQVRQLLCAMRTSERSTEIAALTAAHLGASVVGFDLAGEESGYPASDHIAALRLLDETDVPYTLHVGEHAGLESIRDTLESGSPRRLGHGVRIVEDICLDGRPLTVTGAVAAVAAAGPEAVLTLGRTAAQVRDRGLPLEICLSSNSKGNVVDGRRNHPLGLLHRLGFVVTVNPDNRMMSATSITREMGYAVGEFGWDRETLRTVTRNAAQAAFLPEPERGSLLARLDADAS